MIVSMDDLQWLGDWYRRQCDGEWEHEFGVSIGTLDNPGWSLRVDLTGTDLGELPFAEELDEGEQWYRLWRDESDDAVVFRAVGAPSTLPLLVARFRRWATTGG